MKFSQSNPSPRVSVVIPTWNGRDLLRLVLASLEKQTYLNFETIVVDNGSTDGSLELLSEGYPSVRVVGFPENRGFSVAVNAGIEAARGEYVALLNNDIELDSAWLEVVVRALDSNPGVGFVASRILDYWVRDRIYSAGDQIRGVPNARGYGALDGPEFDVSMPIASACAAAAVYRKKVLDEIGLFNEDLFAYYEDVELGMRAQIAGYSCLYLPEAIAFHMGSTTSNRISKRTAYYRLRNLVQVYFTTLPRAYLLRSLPRLAKTVYWSVRHEAGPGVTGRAALSLIRRFPKMRRRRREIFALRRASDRELERILEPPTPLWTALRRIHVFERPGLERGTKVQ